MQWTGLWTFPEMRQGGRRRLRRVALAEVLGIGGCARRCRSGRTGRRCRRKSKDPQAAKDFVKWLWVDQTADQLDFAQSYGFHVPARASVAAKADKLKSGQAADAVKILQQYGHAQTPLLWTPA